jgi:hypothetical protein
LWIFQIWIIGEKVGEGMGRTRKEAQRQAANMSLRNLAGEFYAICRLWMKNDKYATELLVVDNYLLMGSYFRSWTYDMSSKSVTLQQLVVLISRTRRIFSY